jgi:Predicted transcriptional regulators containing the CopG/Arc/MetJ DNA-binding domain and a metal-binding domain
MANLTRFSVSLPQNLLKNFDESIKFSQYSTRSKAIGDLISESLTRHSWSEDGDVAGAIIFTYDHHKRDLTNNLTKIQHNYHHLIVSSQHVHLDHDNCLEIIVVKGKAKEAKKLTEELNAIKGISHSAVSVVTIDSSELHYGHSHTD